MRKQYEVAEVLAALMLAKLHSMQQEWLLAFIKLLAASVSWSKSCSSGDSSSATPSGRPLISSPASQVGEEVQGLPEGRHPPVSAQHYHGNTCNHSVHLAWPGHVSHHDRP